MPWSARFPRRGRESTKFAAGSVLVCGGSIGLTGAPSMASEAAMRAGAGYVTACVPASLNLVFEARLLEVMTVPIPTIARARFDAGAGRAGARARRACRRARARARASGATADTLAFARAVAGAAEVPLLLDADGLNAHAGRLEPWLAERRRADGADTPRRRARAAARAPTARRSTPTGSITRGEPASAAEAIVVLKGDDTLVAEPDGRVAVSRGGCLGARDGRNRRCALRRDRRASWRSGWTRSTPPARACSSTLGPGGSRPTGSGTRA